MHIDRWFQGYAHCGGIRLFSIPDANSAMFGSACLWLQADVERADFARVVAIIERHFPTRIGCGGCQCSRVTTMIHFNNHPETTKDDIDKVCRIYTEETARE